MTLVLSRMPLPPHLQEQMSSRFPFYDGTKPGSFDAMPAEVAAEVTDLFMPGIITTSDAVFDRLPKLRLITCYGSGYEKVDVVGARKRGIEVANCPGINRECVADLTWGLILSLIRKLGPGDAYVRSGEFAINAPGRPGLVRSVHGSRMGIIGLGEIGIAVAERAAGFRIEVAYTNRKARSDVPYKFIADPMQLAEWCDILVIAARADASNRHMVDERMMRALGKDGVLINISRGTIVDETALVKALNEGWIGGAGLDVYEHEPRVPAELIRAPNTVLTPHIGGMTAYAFQKSLELCMANIEAVAAGKPALTPVA